MPFIKWHVDSHRHWSDLSIIISFKRDYFLIYVSLKSDFWFSSIEFWNGHEKRIKQVLKKEEQFVPSGVWLFFAGSWNLINTWSENWIISRYNDNYTFSLAPFKYFIPEPYIDQQIVKKLLFFEGTVHFFENKHYLLIFQLFWMTAMFYCWKMFVKTRIYINKIVISVFVIVCFSDHNTGISWPIRLNFLLGNSGEPRECFFLVLRV